MSDDPYEQHDPEGPGDMEPSEDQQADGTGHDAIPDADEQQSPDDAPSTDVSGDIDAPERDSFVVELRKRYVRFERGDYRRMKEKEQREREVAASATGSGGRGPVKAPPVNAVTGNDDYEFGTPRSSPFSMTYVPKRKG